MLSFPKNLYSNSDQLALVRNRLATLGFTDHDLTAAVKKFQKSVQLISDGIVGPLTWSKLFTTRIEVVPKSLILRNRAVEYARTQLFVKEKTGHNDGPEVKEYLKLVHLPEGYSWCAAFIYWCFQKASVDLKVPNSLTVTAGVLDHWSRTHGRKVDKGEVNAGDIFIMDFGGGHGHTGIVTAVNGLKVQTIEGNTSADPTLPAEDREGNGVYERLRNISGIKGFIRY